MPIWISDVKEPFAPRCVLGLGCIVTFGYQMSMHIVHIIAVEDYHLSSNHEPATSLTVISPILTSWQADLQVNGKVKVQQLHCGQIKMKMFPVHTRTITLWNNELGEFSLYLAEGLDKTTALGGDPVEALNNLLIAEDASRPHKG